MKTLVLRCNVYDMINETYWPEDFVRWAIQKIGRPEYHFDEIDKCVYWKDINGRE